MFARLVAVDEGPDIVLDRERLVVGRHPACDVRLDVLRVSRHHCCLTLQADVLVVRDLGSTNGTKINGLRVRVGQLRDGDELSIAHIRYRFQSRPSSIRYPKPLPPAPPTDSLRPSDPTWPWVRRAEWDLGPLDEDL
jgi:predicted component of type VI protein secretion system